MTENTHNYRWRKFNWAMGLMFGAIFGAPIYTVILAGQVSLGALFAPIPLFLFYVVFFGSLNLFLGPIWKHPVAFSLD